MNPFLKAFYKVQFSGKKRAEFYDQVISMRKSGRSNLDAVAMAWRVASYDGRKKDDGIAIIYKDIERRLRDGQGFGAAMRPWVPPSESSVIEAMESSDNFASAFESYLALDTRRRAIIGSAIGSMMYPAFLFVAAYGILMYFGLSVMPLLDAVYPMEKWTGSGAVLRYVAIFAREYALVTTLGLAACLAIVMFSLPRWSGMGRKFADRLPIYSTYKSFTGINFLVGMAALTQGGLTTLRAVDKLRKGNTRYVQARLDRIRRNVRNGAKLGSAMMNSEYRNWPDKKMNMSLKIYEDTNDLSQSMMRMSDMWLKQSEKTISSSVGALRVVAMIFIAIVVITIIVGTYDIQGQISNSFTQ